MTRDRRRWQVVVVAACSFLCGVLVGGLVLSNRTSKGEPASQVEEPAPPPEPIGTLGPRPGDNLTSASRSSDIVELRHRDLLPPIQGADVERWKGSFSEEHNGHRHEAVDILSPRNTPIRAVDAGTVAKLFLSEAGGLTIYERDTSDRFIYYYAHLERYANIHEGDRVSRGQVIGYVGTSGNAPKDAPHLHFTIFRVSDPERWWEGTPIDPYLVFSASTTE